ncbi:MAG: DNA recombination protein RmuC [Elusimicrobia bacterium]|nr:DNA recombination protein RmuC [Elusimicrobiota bacterium]
MNILFAILLGITVVLLISLVILMVQSKPQEKNDQPFVLLQQQVESLRKQVNDSMQSNSQAMGQQLNSVIEIVNKQLNNVNKTLGDRLENTSRVVGEVQKGLGSLSQSTERILEVGKDISSLQEILKAPKLRGSLGELFLNELLSQILPPENFAQQYKFKSGEIVDAIVKIGNKIVSVDSKFPLENFVKMLEAKTDDEKRSLRKKFITDVKKHIDSIASKYILPDEGTFDFALMYIPAENVYYETIIKNDLLDERAISSYALEKRIVPVSPNSLYAYLQVIVLGLKGLQVEKNAQSILENLQRLKGDFERFKTEFEILGKHLNSAKSKYEDSDKRLIKFEERLASSSDNVAVPAGTPVQKNLLDI